MVMLDEDQVFRWRRKPRPEWVAALRRMGAPSERLSWLELVWEPGEPNAPVQRWVIYEMVPAMATPSLLLEPKRMRMARHGAGLVPDPRWPLPLNEGLLTPVQWRLFRETGSFGHPFWIIQGHQGGHKLQFSHTESALAEMHGFSPDAPAPGSLPYAEWDNRVEAKLRQMDRLQAYQGSERFDERGVDAVEEEENERKLQFQREVWDWMSTQVESVFGEMAGMTQDAVLDATWEGARLVDDAPDYMEKLEAFEHEFTTTII